MSNGVDVVCLFDENGLSADAWCEAGCDVWCYDLETTEYRREAIGSGAVHFMPWDATGEEQCKELVVRHVNRAAIVLAFPPCTDLAVSGAAHFASKREKNPNFQHDAMELFYVSVRIANQLGAPYAIENPVSVAATMWRKPDVSFHPWEYGGYLPEDDVHPMYPEYIAPRDAYPKRTCYWTGNGFIMPQPSPVEVRPGYSDQHLKLGGKSKKTKRIRSASPRGVARAICMANLPWIMK